MGETVTSYSRTRTASNKTLLVLSCVVFLVLSAILYLCIFGLTVVKHHQQMIVDGKTATAEIYACTQSGTLAPWYCVYRYFDENGAEYWGNLKPIYKTEEEAAKHIGEKVEIYIDGKGDCFPVGEQPNIGGAITWITIMSLLVCANAVGIVLISVKICKERRNRSKNQ